VDGGRTARALGIFCTREGSGAAEAATGGVKLVGLLAPSFRARPFAPFAALPVTAADDEASAGGSAAAAPFEAVDEDARSAPETFVALAP
jgi:hypothetical protein